MKKPVTVAIVGLGNRGMDIYANYQNIAPDEMKIVAVADLIPEKVERAKKQFNISAENCFTSAEELLKAPQLAELLVVATQDRQHVGHAVPALKKGYHVLCEKPISPLLKDCLLLQQTAHDSQRIVALGHVLRYAPFFAKIKELVASGIIGRVATIQARENVVYWHQAHSYVRGNWKNSETSSPMIMAKSCHDLDIFVWLMDTPCKRLSSYGSTFLFREENAPKGSTAFCMDGCTAKEACPYDAEKIYITSPKTGIRRVISQGLKGELAWPTSVLSQELTEESIYSSIKTGPYGRCVYRCKNNVVDQQVVNMEFEGGATVAFTMSAFTAGGGRDLKIMGTSGDIVADMAGNTITVNLFGQPPQVIDVLTLATDFSGHGGGDKKLIHDVLATVADIAGKATGEEELRTGIDVSVQSHIIALAAEYSRLHDGKSVQIDEFCNLC